jgi:hypothetical protein
LIINEKKEKRRETEIYSSFFLMENFPFKVQNLKKEEKKEKQTQF